MVERRFSPPSTRCNRIPLCALLTLYAATPNKLTSARNLLAVLNCPRFQITRVTQRHALVHATVFAAAGPSRHSWGSSGDVSQAEVWGIVKVNKLFVSSCCRFLRFHLFQDAFHERHSYSLSIFAL